MTKQSNKQNVCSSGYIIGAGFTFVFLGWLLATMFTRAPYPVLSPQEVDAVLVLVKQNNEANSPRDKGDCIKAAFLLVQLNEVNEYVKSKENKAYKHPESKTAVEEAALIEFRLAGKGEIYSNYLELKYETTSSNEE